MRLNLWSSPRNISTALMYAFGNRPDTAVVDEPLYAHYLLHQPTRAEHPMREAILAAQGNDWESVVADILTHDYGRANVVFKQMTHHLIELDRNFIYKMDNVLLIRDPFEIVRSFAKVVDGVTPRDIGIPQQLTLFEELKAAERLTAVIDARLLLLEPRRVLTGLCARLDLPFTERMLHWPAGPRPEDGVWAPHWYGNVHRSTGFQAYRPRPRDLPPALAAVAGACVPAYQKMLADALR